MNSPDSKVGGGEQGDEDALFTTFDQIAVGVAHVALTGEFLRVNPKMCEIVGYTRAELLQRTFRDVTFPDDLQLPLSADLLAGRIQSGSVDKRYIRKDGSIVWVHLSSAVARSPSGEARYLVTVVEDVSDRKRAEEARREEEERFRATFEQAAVGMAHVSPAGRLIRVNQRLCELFGYPHDELLQKTFRDITHPDDFTGDLQLFSDVLAGRIKTYSIEKRYYRKDGTLVWGSLTVSLVREPSGAPKYVIGVVADISDRKRAEQELARSNEELEQFAYVASHDLQEPLRVVASYVQLLERRYKNQLDADARDFINFAVNATKRMQRLINDLLEYSRVGRRPSTVGSVDAEAALGHVVVNLQTTIEETAAVVTHDALPTVQVDERQLVQLLQNLVANAIKFRRSEAPLVHVSARRTGRMWTFSVRDDGIGIAPEYHQRIFVAFQRLHGQDEFPGTGIGLAICKKIVERYDGRIWVESEPGKYSTFHFTLPGAKADE